MLSYLILAGFLVGAMGDPTTTTPNIDGIVQGMFQGGDANHDGIYSKAELWARLSSNDKDGDNLLSKKEYVAVWQAVSLSLTNVGIAIFDKLDFDKNGFLNQTDVSVAYASTDLDSNGEVSFSEFSQYIKPILTAVLAPTVVVPQPVIDATFAMIDRNNDGYISFDEAWADAKHFDTNGDDKVGKVEFMIELGNVTLGFEEWPDIFDLIDSNGDQFIDKPEVVGFYKMEDTDGNGMVSNAELTAVMQKMGQMLTARNMTTASLDYGFGDADVNHNGKVTLEEEWNNLLLLDNNTDHKVSLAEFMTIFQFYDDHMKNAALKVFQKYDTDNSGFFERPNIATFFSEMDIDGNGMVSRNTYATFIEVIFSRAGADIRAATMAFGRNTTSTSLDYGFMEADKNHDGQLTLDEEWDNFIRLDNNTDNKVSLAEFMTIFQFYDDHMKNTANKVFQKYDTDNSGFFERPNIATFFNEMDTDGDGMVSRNTYAKFIELIFTRAGADIRAESMALENIMHGFDEADKNHDGLLSVDEQWATALVLDKDGDARLSKAEYLTGDANLPANIQAARPKIFDRFDSDKNGYLEKTDVIKAYPQADKSGDGFLSRFEYVSFVYQLYASFGIDLSSGTTNTQLDFGFDEADTNHDGVISVDEQWVQALKIDTNGDGKLSSDEYANAYANGPAAMKAAVPKLFKVLDVDNSTFLEKLDAVTGFRSIDTSGDGKVQKVEYVTFFTQLFARFGIILNTPDLSDYGFSVIDANHDGQVTFDEQWAAVIVLDTNGDNRVSQAEYLKSLPPQVASIGPKIFQKFDTDSNGFFEKVDIRRYIALVDTNGDGTVSSAEYTSFVGTLLTSLGIDLSAFTTPMPTPAS